MDGARRHLGASLPFPLRICGERWKGASAHCHRQPDLEAAFLSRPVQIDLNVRRLGPPMAGIRQIFRDDPLCYGYESPTAFNRAFQAVHKVPPSQAKQTGVKLKAFPTCQAPLGRCPHPGLLPDRPAPCSSRSANPYHPLLVSKVYRVARSTLTPTCAWP